ncbi:hypothetical protein CHR55_26240 [Rhodococcus qingshengii]|uniref:Uncharacterized protein n=1 Tax=Rhodococcus qingshengii TaxID=334542 RepID=A0A2A5J4V2_RHOSG|nr:hypothetical protein CHR55_26240 [Rhodococcus qingshengii]
MIYQRLSNDQRKALAAQTLYYYISDKWIDHVSTGSESQRRLTKRRRTRSFWPGLPIGRKANYLYAGHTPRGRWLNHEMRSTPTTVFVISGDVLLKAVGDAPIFRRAWDNAIAVFADLNCAVIGYQTGVHVRAIKRSNTPPVVG